MFSKTEREFLLGNYLPSEGHRRYLRHRINKKLEEFYNNELPLLQNTSVSEFANGVRKFNNALENYNSKTSLGRDLNPRPNAYEAFALPG